jgi:hypothetical protein
VDRAIGSKVAAQAALIEAEEIALAVGAGTDSDLGRKIHCSALAAAFKRRVYLRSWGQSAADCRLLGVAERQTEVRRSRISRDRPVLPKAAIETLGD